MAWRRTRWPAKVMACLAAWAALPAGGVWAADVPETNTLNQWLRSRRVEFSLNLGRVAVWSRNYYGSSSSRSSGSTRSERLSIRTNRVASRAGGFSVTVGYELSTSEEVFKIDAESDRLLQIRREPKGDSQVVPVEFVQEAGRPVRLAIGADDERKAHEAPSLWHLVLAEPAAVREHLAPILKPIMPDSDLVGQAEKLPARMIEMAAAQETPDTERWAELVVQLGHDQYALREAADRALRQAGPNVLAFLRNLDYGKLDAEQQFRVKRIIRSMTRTPGSDTIDSIAEWMLTDARAWLILLGRDEEATRRAAAQRLEVLLGEPIGFDPSADPTLRRKQIESLRKRIEGA